MQNLFFLIVFFLSSSEILAQQSFSGTVTYKTEFMVTENEFKDLKKSNPRLYKNYKAMATKAADAVEQLEYVMLFNSTASIFKAKEILNRDDSMLSSLQKTIGIYFNNVKTGEAIQQLEQEGRVYLIEKEPLKWEISEETKVIAGFTCRKATSSQNFYSHRTQQNYVQEIEAWFSPEIPVAFGPKGYSGLPGIILDITVAQEHIYVTRLDLSNEQVEVKKPAKGRRVSFEEFQAISAGLGEKFRQFNGID